MSATRGVRARGNAANRLRGFSTTAPATSGEETKAAASTTAVLEREVNLRSVKSALEKIVMGTSLSGLPNKLSFARVEQGVASASSGSAPSMETTFELDFETEKEAAEVCRFLNEVKDDQGRHLFVAQDYPVPIGGSSPALLGLTVATEDGRSKIKFTVGTDGFAFDRSLIGRAQKTTSTSTSVIQGNINRSVETTNITLQTKGVNQFCEKLEKSNKAYLVKAGIRKEKFEEEDRAARKVVSMGASALTFGLPILPSVSYGVGRVCQFFGLDRLAVPFHKAAASLSKDNIFLPGLSGKIEELSERRVSQISDKISSQAAEEVWQPVRGGGFVSGAGTFLDNCKRFITNTVPRYTSLAVCSAVGTCSAIASIATNFVGDAVAQAGKYLSDYGKDLRRDHGKFSIPGALSLIPSSLSFLAKGIAFPFRATGALTGSVTQVCSDIVRTDFPNQNFFRFNYNNPAVQRLKLVAEETGIDDPKRSVVRAARDKSRSFFQDIAGKENRKEMMLSPALDAWEDSSNPKERIDFEVWKGLRASTKFSFDTELDLKVINQANANTESIGKIPCQKICEFKFEGQTWNVAVESTTSGFVFYRDSQDKPTINSFPKELRMESSQVLKPRVEELIKQAIQQSITESQSEVRGGAVSFGTLIGTQSRAEAGNSALLREQLEKVGIKEQEGSSTFSFTRSDKKFNLTKDGNLHTCSSDGRITSEEKIETGVRSKSVVGSPTAAGGGEETRGNFIDLEVLQIFDQMNRALTKDKTSSKPTSSAAAKLPTEKPKTSPRSPTASCFSVNIGRSRSG